MENNKNEEKEFPERKYPEELIEACELLTFLPDDQAARMQFMGGLLFTLYLT